MSLWLLQLRASCSDVSRLAMLRACLQQRLRTTLRTFRNVHGAEAAGGASTLSTRKSLSMGADNALRNMERAIVEG